MTPKKIAKDALDYLVTYTWRGNVRELENFVKHIIVVADGDRITSRELAAHFPAASFVAAVEAHTAQSHNGAEPSGTGAVASGHETVFGGYTWEELEKAYVMYLLEKNKWHITRAAKDAGVNRSTFDSRMKKLGIRK